MALDSNLSYQLFPQIIVSEYQIILRYISNDLQKQRFHKSERKRTSLPRQKDRVITAGIRLLSQKLTANEVRIKALEEKRGKLIQENQEKEKELEEIKQ